MGSEQILIAANNGEYRVKILGRANFACAVPLRQLGRSFADGLKGLTVDASECTFMDSTFLGVLSMLALQARKFGVNPVICGASEHVCALLKGLGVSKVFSFADSAVGNQNVAWHALSGSQSRLETAETVVEAHETLVETDSANQERFKDVICFAKDDVERLKKESES